MSIKLDNRIDTKIILINDSNDNISSISTNSSNQNFSETIRVFLSQMDNLIIYSVAVVLIIAIFKWLLGDGDSLTARGIPNEKPLPIIGNGLEIILKRMTVIDFFEGIYKRFAHEKLVYKI